MSLSGVLQLLMAERLHVWGKFSSPRHPLTASHHTAKHTQRKVKVGSAFLN